MNQLWSLFRQGPILGSLIDPGIIGGDLFAAEFERVRPALLEALTAGTESDGQAELAFAAKGIVSAAAMLTNKFTLIATNVPYLGRAKQCDELKKYIATHHASGKADLSTAFIQRCLRFAAPGGSVALVTPQNWMFLGTYETLRRELFANTRWEAVAKLGPAAFREMNWWAANTAMFVLSRTTPTPDHRFAGLDVSAPRHPDVKTEEIKRCSVALANQSSQVRNPDARVLFESMADLPLLAAYAESFQGVSPADFDHFGRNFWELSDFGGWRFWQSTIRENVSYGGRNLVLWWNHDFLEAVDSGVAFVRGERAWGKGGVVVRQMRHLPSTIYTGEVFDTNCAVIVPRDQRDLPALWAFCTSDEYTGAVRQLDQKTNVTNATLVKVPFDISRWRSEAEVRFPAGLPRPSSQNPTQWLFSGLPIGSEAPLQVAVARLCGFLWPRQAGCSFMEAPEVGADNLADFGDVDGIVCLPGVNAEATGVVRLLSVLSSAFGDRWSPGELSHLLDEVGYGSAVLEQWLREAFFSQHCTLFADRPFIWHIWDGVKDGFSALVNYHRLAAPNGEGRKTLEKLRYSYLGDWIERQRADTKRNVEGADLRLAAAEHLAGELEKILHGEPPYDIFVRWRPLHEQPIGWDPDINDGVRINIRPFMMAKPFKAKGKNACILRATPNIKWTKDRGKEPHRAKENYPWFWGWDEQTEDFAGGSAFDGNRWNDLHYTRASKEAARARRLERG